LEVFADQNKRWELRQNFVSGEVKHLLRRGEKESSRGKRVLRKKQDLSRGCFHRTLDADLRGRIMGGLLGKFKR